jgi:hypothetical protein
MKNWAVKCAVQILETPKSYFNLKNPRWVKLGMLFYDKVDTLKQTLFLQKGHKKRAQNKILSLKSNKNKTKK